LEPTALHNALDLQGEFIMAAPGQQSPELSEAWCILDAESIYPRLASHSMTQLASAPRNA